MYTILKVSDIKTIPKNINTYVFGSTTGSDFCRLINFMETIITGRHRGINFSGYTLFKMLTNGGKYCPGPVEAHPCGRWQRFPDFIDVRLQFCIDMFKSINFTVVLGSYIFDRFC